MKYAELSDKWKKEAEKMEINYINQSLEEMKTTESSEYITELVTEQLLANNYTVIKENNTEILVREA